MPRHPKHATLTTLTTLTAPGHVACGLRLLASLSLALAACGGDPQSAPAPSRELGSPAGHPPSTELVPSPTGAVAEGPSQATPDLPQEVEVPGPPPIGESPTAARPEAAASPKDAKRLERSGDFARDLVAALRSDDPTQALMLTPYDKGEWATRCPDAGLSGGVAEAKARLNHCGRSIPWKELADVRVSGGARATAAAEACADTVHSFDRLRMVVVTSSGNFEMEVRDGYGREDAIEAFSGAISCRALEG